MTIQAYLDAANSLLHKRQTQLLQAHNQYTPTPDHVETLSLHQLRFDVEFLSLKDEHFPKCESATAADTSQVWVVVAIDLLPKLVSWRQENLQSDGDASLLPSIQSIVEAAERVGGGNISQAELKTKATAERYLRQVARRLVIAEATDDSQLAQSECVERYENYVAILDKIQRLQANLFKSLFDYGWNMRSDGAAYGELERAEHIVSFCARVQGLGILIARFGEPERLKQIAERVNNWLKVTTDGHGWFSPLTNSHPLDALNDPCPDDYLQRIRATGCAAEFVLKAIDGADVAALAAIAKRHVKRLDQFTFEELRWQYNCENWRTTEPVRYVPTMLCGGCGYSGPHDGRSPMRCPYCSDRTARARRNAIKDFKYTLAMAARWEVSSFEDAPELHETISTAQMRFKALCVKLGICDYETVIDIAARRLAVYAVDNTKLDKCVVTRWSVDEAEKQLLVGEGKSRASKDKKNRQAWFGDALAELKKDPSKLDVDIALSIGVHKSTLSRHKEWQAMRKTLALQAFDQIPKGTKFDGCVDAFDE